MGWTNGLRRAVLDWLLASDLERADKARIEDALNLRDYAQGAHRRQMRVKPGGGDDNLATNFTGLIVERGISLLYGSGITFKHDDDNAQAWLDEVWAANKQAQTLYRLAQFGGVYGTPYVKIIPDGLTWKGKTYPRLVVLHPLWMRIDCETEDLGRVEKYVVEYAFEERGQTYIRREITRLYNPQEGLDGAPQAEVYDPAAGWVVERYIRKAGGGGYGWMPDGDSVIWPYMFPPIMHWQNLPDGESQYGRSDIGDVIDLQDRYNFVTANVSKVIRNHAHPKTWARDLGQMDKASWGADEMILANSPNAMIANLEMASDLTSSRAFALDLRQAIFDVARTPDITSVADKIGSLTNFGLHVLFMDALNKNNTRRELYGDGLTEINRRLLVLGGLADETTADGGTIVWPAPMPENDLEEAATLEKDLGLGLVSKETASGARGYDWATEQERMQSDQAQTQTVGALALKSFLNGG